MFQKDNSVWTKTEQGFKNTTCSLLNNRFLYWLPRFGARTIDGPVRQRDRQRHQAPVWTPFVSAPFHSQNPSSNNAFVQNYDNTTPKGAIIWSSTKQNVMFWQRGDEYGLLRSCHGSSSSSSAVGWMKMEEVLTVLTIVNVSLKHVWNALLLL